MSNPFAQGGMDPFGELAAGQQANHAEIKPTRRPPPKPAAPFSVNPFAQAPATAAVTTAAAPADDDPFGLLAATTPAAGVGQHQGHAAAAAHQQPQQQAWDDDVFGLLTSPQPSAGVSTHSSNSSAPGPPSYTQAAALPFPYKSVGSGPPAYDAASGYPAAPPAYEQAVDLPPPSYEDVMGQPPLQRQQQQQKQQQAQPLRPARAAPAAPTPAGTGPVTASRPSRPAPAAPGTSGVTPARAPPAAPGHLGSGAGPVPARPAPRAPPPAAAGLSTGPDPDMAAAMSGLVMCDSAGGQAGSSESSSSSRSQCAAATTGNVGTAPKGSIFGGQQVHQQELGAQIRLPPLNPKATAALKHLSAGMGALFAGPVDDATLLLQWNTSSSGSSLPMGGAAYRQEDHDSAAAAALGQGHLPGIGSSSSSKSRVSCVVFGPVPGRLWAGCADGRVHCWDVGGDGAAARLLHSWEAHSGKIKGIALSPCGRLFTGSSNGSLKMWSYGSPTFTYSAAPRLLRQLKRVDQRSGVASNPHGKVVGLAVSSGGRVLWSVGKDSASLWSVHNGEHLGSLSESGTQESIINPFAVGPYGSPYTQQLQAPASADPAGDINPKQGLEPALLDSLFQRPSAELLAEEDAFDNEKDAASVAYNAAVKGAAKAGKLFNKLTKIAAAKIKDEGKLGLREDSNGSGHNGSSFSAGAAAGGTPGPYDADAGLEGKVGRWGSIKKLAAAADSSLWLSYKRGLLERYSEGGRLLWSSSSAASAGGAAPFKPAGITALAAAGSSMWVGDQQGRIWVLDASSGAVTRTWAAHVFPVRSIAAAGPLVYSLGRDGGIRAWPALAPPVELTAAWRADTQDCLQQQQLKVGACTWNVNENKPSRPGLELWLGERVRDAHLVLIGLQEVEMGTGSVALDVVYQQLAKSKLEAGTQAAQAWSTAIGEVLSSRGSWRRIALRQMSGILALVYARAELEPHIGEVSTASVACGVMGYGGNKGAAAISFSLFRRRVVLVSSHFAAHQDKVKERNDDYAKIVRHLHFHNVPTDKAQQQSQGDGSSAVVLDSSSSPSSHQQQQQQQQKYGAGGPASSVGPADEEWGAGMKDAEFLVWLGDFNYRVDQPQGFVSSPLNPDRPASELLYHFVLQKIAARQHTELLTGDQCGREMARGSIFHGLAEGPIHFLPTYKFEKNRESSIMQPFYDQGEKMRVPAWTDRIFFRASAPQQAALQPNSAESAADVRVSLTSPSAYNAVLEVNDSDHKPVYAQLSLVLPWYQQQQLRSASLARLWQVAQLQGSSSSSSGAEGPVALSVEPQQLVLAGSHLPRELLVRNPLQDRAVLFAVCCGVSGVPAWLEVVPSSGVLGPGAAVRVRVQGNKGGAWGRAGGGLGCELRVVGCVEGSIGSSVWPLGWAGAAAAVSVVLH